MAPRLSILQLSNFLAANTISPLPVTPLTSPLLLLSMLGVAQLRHPLQPPQRTPVSGTIAVSVTILEVHLSLANCHLTICPRHRLPPICLSRPWLHVIWAIPANLNNARS
jgi:hypothetical protein